MLTVNRQAINKQGAHTSMSVIHCKQWSVCVRIEVDQTWMRILKHIYRCAICSEHTGATDHWLHINWCAKSKNVHTVANCTRVGSSVIASFIEICLQMTKLNRLLQHPAKEMPAGAVSSDTDGPEEPEHLLVTADAIHKASFARGRVYSHSR